MNKTTSLEMKKMAKIANKMKKTVQRKMYDDSKEEEDGQQQ